MKGQTFHPVYHLNDSSEIHGKERHLILKKKGANIYKLQKFVQFWSCKIKICAIIIVRQCH